MGLSSGKPDHARRGAHAHRRPDRGKAPARLCAGGLAGGLSLLFLLAAVARAEPLKLATWNADFSREGPGLLLDDLRDGDESARVAEIAALGADVLLLTDIDYDHGLAALRMLAGLVREEGPDYTALLALRPNTGRPTGRDLDGDGRLGGPRDAQGYGEFAGQGGMALLSVYPLELVRDFSALLWRDLPQTGMTAEDPAGDLQRLSSSGHWVVRVAAPGGPVTLLAYAATPPVFDGPEDRNGRRNRDELRLWRHYLDGAFGDPPARRYVLMGDANLDPARGDGLREAMRALLEDPRFQDPLPGRPTVAWEATGPMRVSYVLPSADLEVRDAGVRPPVRDGGHRPVWVTLELH